MRPVVTRSLLAATLVASGAAAAAAAACARTEPPACRPSELARIDAAFVAEAVEACRGETVDTCKAYPAIKAKYAAQREEWVSCR